MPRKLLAALSDERLVEHVRRGEPVAFEVLYDRHSAGILGFCRHLLGSAGDAEDATQNTFMSAHADIQRHGRRDLHVKAWLYTVARNRCLSVLRARREQPASDGLEVATDDFLHDVENREDIRALLGDIAKLPEAQRAALVLAETAGLSHNDISEVLGCEVSKVKSLVFQARTTLIDRRNARETPCAEIREQLATLRGGALRRSQLRHHLEACPGCTEYREQIRRQRAMLAVALPVVPSLALRAKVLGGVGLGGSSAAATGGAAGGLGFVAQGGVAAKLGVAAALAAGSVGGATIANGGVVPLVQHQASTAGQAGTHGGGNAAPSAAHAGRTASGNTDAKAHPTTGSRRSASGTQHGFTPITGQSNGARARAFAQTRGKGAQTSAAHRHAAARTHPAKPVHSKHVATPRKQSPSQPAQPTHRTRQHAAPSKPVHTQPVPAPKGATPQPTTTQPAPVPPTTTTPVPTSTQPAPAIGGGNSKSTGKTLDATG